MHSRLLRTASFVASCAAFIAVSGAASSQPTQPDISVCTSELLRRHIPDGANVQLLAAAADTIPKELLLTYRRMELAIFSCAGAKAEVVLRPITASAFTESPMFDRMTPDADPNPLRRHATMAAFMADAAAAVDRLPVKRNTGEIEQKPGHPESGRNSDPIGALQAAGLDLQGVMQPKRVIMVFKGWQQSRDFNIFVYHRDPAEFIEPVLSGLHASNGVPQLKETEVMIFGLTAGPREMGTKLTQINRLCKFWTAVIQDAGGTLVRCSGDMPGVSTPPGEIGE